MWAGACSLAAGGASPLPLLWQAAGGQNPCHSLIWSQAGQNQTTPRGLQITFFLWHLEGPAHSHIGAPHSPFPPRSSSTCSTEQQPRCRLHQRPLHLNSITCLSQVITTMSQETHCVCCLLARGGGGGGLCLLTTPQQCAFAYAHESIQACHTRTRAVASLALTSHSAAAQLLQQHVKLLLCVGFFLWMGFVAAGPMRFNSAHTFHTGPYILEGRTRLRQLHAVVGQEAGACQLPPRRPLQQQLHVCL